MFHRTTLISLVTTSVVAGAGVGTTFLLGGFNKSPKSQIKRVIGKNKPQTRPDFDSADGKDGGAKVTEGSAKEAILKREAGELYEGKHPWTKELLSFMGRSSNQRNVPTLIAEGCVSNSDGEVDIKSTKGQMLEKLCDATFEQS